MKPLILASIVALTPFKSSTRAAEQIVTLGDSLTFAYEAEFGFQYTVPPFGPTIGDGFGPQVRNWIEILNDPNYRNEYFDIGTRDTYTIAGIPPFIPAERFLFRHEYNWAIPGLKIDQLRRFINGTAGFIDILAENPDFAPLVTAIGFTDFEASQFALIDFERQIQNTAERLTFFIGGNDVRGIYGTVYNGDPPGSFVDDFMTDAIAVLDRVQELNSGIQVVIVNVPHIGITPDIKASSPTDTIKTARVTAVLDELNGRLCNLARTRGFGYADVYTSTLSLLEADPLCIHGIPFENTGSATGDLSKVWLNGPISANFHPNTNAHAIVANAVIDAFNDTYNIGIPLLTATEILGGLHAKSSAEIDMSFAVWMDCFGLEAPDESDDSDRDGIKAGVEFGLGLNPTLNDTHKLRHSLIDQPGGGRAIEITYPLRLPDSNQVTVLPATGSTLSDFTPFAEAPAVESDGLYRALLPLVPGQSEFIRIDASLITSP